MIGGGSEMIPGGSGGAWPARRGGGAAWVVGPGWVFWVLAAWRLRCRVKNSINEAREMKAAFAISVLSLFLQLWCRSPKGRGRREHPAPGTALDKLKGRMAEGIRVETRPVVGSSHWEVVSLLDGLTLLVGGMG